MSTATAPVSTAKKLGIVRHQTMAESLGVQPADWKSVATKGKEKSKNIPAPAPKTEEVNNIGICDGCGKSLELFHCEETGDARCDSCCRDARKPKVAAIAPKAEAPKEKRESKTAPAIAKADQTVLDNGLTYSLLSRVKHAYKAEEIKALEAGKKVLSMVDGRGQTQEISEAYVQIALDLGGAEWLKTVRTSHVRTALKAKKA